jgi:hypothetical protein
MLAVAIAYVTQENRNYASRLSLLLLDDHGGRQHTLFG